MWAPAMRARRVGTAGRAWCTRRRDGPTAQLVNSSSRIKSGAAHSHALRPTRHATHRCTPHATRHTQVRADLCELCVQRQQLLLLPCLIHAPHSARGRPRCQAKATAHDLNELPLCCGCTTRCQSSLGRRDTRRGRMHFPMIDYEMLCPSFAPRSSHHQLKLNSPCVKFVIYTGYNHTVYLRISKTGLKGHTRQRSITHHPLS